MGYIEASDVRTKIWQVTETQVSNDVVNTAINMAAADIDSALAMQYNVPFEETYPEIIVAINNALVRYYGQVLTGHSFHNLNEPDQEAFKWAQAKLLALKSGTETIPGVSRRGARVRCNTKDYSPTFNLDNPLDWGVDDDRLDDIATGRE